jgi:hypothetical protein
MNFGKCMMAFGEFYVSCAKVECTSVDITYRSTVTIPKSNVDCVFYGTFEFKLLIELSLG